MATKGRNTSVWRTQPDGPVGINWEHRRAEGLVFFAPLSPAHGTRDLVSGQLGTRTGLENFAPTSGASHSHFGTSNYADFVVPPEIGSATPFSVAWTQDAIATSGYSTILNVNFGTAGTHKAFVIYQSVSDAGYYFAFGPRSGTANGLLYAGLGAVANGRRDRFCLTVPNGSQSTAAVSLSRNGENVSSSGATTFGNNTAASFRVGALDSAGDPWEGVIGDLRIWSRALNDTEKDAESSFEESLLLYAPRRIWVPVSAGGGGVTGTVAYTNANDTSAASGTTTVTGTLARTNANDTSAASGTTTVVGTLAKTNANDTSAASGTTTVVGTLARTNADDTSAASGTVGSSGSTGTVAYTNANDTSAASGSPVVAGTLARTNADDSVVASGWAGLISGTLAYTNNNDTAVASGSGGEVSDTGLGGGFDVFTRKQIRTVHHKPSARLWWQRKPAAMSEEDAEEALSPVAAAVSKTVREQIKRGSPPSKTEAKKAVKDLLPGLPGFDWNAYYQQAYAAAKEAQQQPNEVVAPAQLAALLQSIDRARLIDEDDEDVLLLASI